MNLKVVKSICYVLFGIFAVLMVIMIVTGNLICGYAAIIVLSIQGMFSHSFWCCPKCKKNLGALWAKECLFCGEKIE